MAWRDFAVELLGASDVCTKFTLSTVRVQLRVSLGEKIYKSEVLEVRRKALVLNKLLVFSSPSGSRAKFELIQVHSIAQPEILGSAEIELAAMIRGFDGTLSLKGSRGDSIGNFKVNMYFLKPEKTEQLPQLVRQNQRTFSEVSDTLTPLFGKTAQMHESENSFPVFITSGDYDTFPPIPVTEPELFIAATPAQVSDEDSVFSPSSVAAAMADVAVGTDVVMVHCDCQTEPRKAPQLHVDGSYTVNLFL